MTFSIFSCFLHIRPVVFKPLDKAVILRACDFFDLFVFSAYSTSCIQSPRQSRHPERSASQMDRVTQGLWRGVEGPRRCLIYRCRSELFNHRGRQCLSLEARTQRSTPDHSSAYRSRVLLSGVGGRKAPSSMGRLNAAEVLRLRATRAVSRDKSVRRSAQDDDFVGG